ncbi:HAD family hydrolase [Natronomonas sp. EA1]|uniref:HAD family hydrolase n=1 Tax=Natronomonas sp. EA1 TaxID=3421655 RepID=UPI003EC1496A
MALHTAFDGICFDMDGVLIRSEEHWVEQQREQILPTTAPDDDIPLAAITGRNFREVYPDLVAEYEVAVSRDEFEAMFETTGERIYREQAQLFDGVPELLAELRNRGVPLALVTSSPRDWIGLLDERFGLTGHFDAVVSAEDLDGPGKPAPAIYERGAAELGLTPDACLAVEDSTAGVQAATAAGLWTVGFRGDGAETDLSAADEIVVGVPELRSVLLGEER